MKCDSTYPQKGEIEINMTYNNDVILSSIQYKIKIK